VEARLHPSCDLRWGLCSRVSDLDSHCRPRIRDGAAGAAPVCAELPQGAIRSDKDTMIRNVGRRYTEQLRLEAEETLLMFARRDSHAIGASAFEQGRKPEWPHHGL
jgi:enoyl-CoA hydratase/carnithine racemase